MTYEQVRTLATQYESALAVLGYRDADWNTVRHAALVLACTNLIELELLVMLACNGLADRRTSACEAESYARSFESLQALVARYRALLNMPPGGAQA